MWISVCECVCCVYAVCFCFHSLPFTRMAHRHEHEHEHWYTEHDYDTCMRIFWMSMYWFELIIICFLDRLHFSEAVSLRALSSSLSHSIFFFSSSFNFMFLLFFFLQICFNVCMQMSSKNCCLLSFCWQCHRFEREWRKIKTLIIWLC